MSKIPKNAKLVFKGVIFDTYQWQQEMFDGSFATFEMLKRPNTLAVIPVFGDKVLMADEEQPGLKREISIFTGRQNEGESFLEGAKRELLEESGMISDDWEEFYTANFHYKIEWESHFFIARNCKKIKEPELEAGEKITIKEMSFDEFLDCVSSEKFGFREISDKLFRIKQDPEELEKFRNKLFPSIR